jgi:ribonuclease-3
LSRPAALETRLGHRFTRLPLLELALTRGGPREDNNQRLEFLGDAVLDCVMAEELYLRYPSLQEGDLHRLQVSMIRDSTLAQAARGIGLKELLKASVPTVRESTLADTLEAIFGAVFLDAGYEAAKTCILYVLKPFMGRLDPARPEKDAKTQLQELLQARFKSVPSYRMTRSSGAAHEKTFEVECRVAELGLAAAGAGSSRQRAEQEAASAMLRQLPKA